METVLIADDHEIVRRGVRMIIQSFPQNYHFIEVSSCAEVIRAFSGEQVHHAILDMSLADGSIFTAIDQITAGSPPANILVYSMSAERIYARRLMEKGVRGFVCKRASMEELEKAVRTILKGEIYLSTNLKADLLQQLETGPSKNPIDLLSDRELEVVEYIAIGMRTKEIAGKMNLDITTISTYRRRAFEKLDVQNMVELKEKFLLYKAQAG